MKKRKKGRKFNRETSQRKALLIGLANNLFLKEKIKTTQAKAKELAGFAEKYITKAKEINLAKKRLLLRDLSSRVVAKLEKEIAPRYKTRPGGYTRIIKLGRRTKSDGAKMAIIELIK
ncbi:MAG: 50S ribosomal protein L17 [Candidatus Nealsonbacteria bacterium]|nr:50S ribosomal protein L17 [Candidatus Nealsonbacteria bacterium]